MEPRLINIGFGNSVSASRVVAIVSPETSPIKRIIQEARDEGNLVDAETVAHRFLTKEVSESGNQDTD